MPLPSDPNAPWPPKTWQPIAHDIAEASVWYGGNERDLEDFYGGQRQPARPSDRATGQGLLSRVRFWSRRSDDRHTDRQRLHAPAAADVAATAADLLFGDEATLTIPEAHEENAPSEAKEAEERLSELAEVDGWASTLMEAAEVASGLGLVFLRPVWDTEITDHPILDVVHGDHAVPEYRLRQLTAVTFWRVVQVDGRNEVWRWLERYERGAMLNGLYVGRHDALGRKVGLDAHPDTRGLPDVVELPEALRGELLVRAVPNAPNRRHRRWPVGRADTAGNEPMMDALDETWTSLVRDIRLAKARIIVPDEFLHRGGRGQGAGFDTDNEVFSPLNMDPASQEKAGITLTSFEIRTEEHLRAIAEMFQGIVRGAGYSPQSFGMQGEGHDATATEVDARASSSMRTTARKQRYWRRRVEDIAEMMLVIDRDVFRSGVEPMRPRLEFAEPDDDSPRERAETLELLVRAQAVSIETRVRMAQPDLDPEQVKAEVARIQAEQSLNVDDPTGGFPPGDGGRGQDDEGQDGEAA